MPRTRLHLGKNTVKVNDGYIFLISAHTLFKRETPTDVEDVENDEEEVGVPAPTEQEEGEDESEHQGAEVSSPVAQLKQAVSYK